MQEYSENNKNAVSAPPREKENSSRTHLRSVLRDKIKLPIFSCKYGDSKVFKARHEPDPQEQPDYRGEKSQVVRIRSNNYIPYTNSDREAKKCKIIPYTLTHFA